MDLNPLTAASLFVLLLSHIASWSQSICPWSYCCYTDCLCSKCHVLLLICQVSEVSWAIFGVVHADPVICWCTDCRSCDMSPLPLQVLLVGKFLFMKDNGSVIFQLNLIRKMDL